MENTYIFRDLLYDRKCSSDSKKILAGLIWQYDGQKHRSNLEKTDLKACKTSVSLQKAKQGSFVFVCLWVSWLRYSYDRHREMYTNLTEWKNIQEVS